MADSGEDAKYSTILSGDTLLIFVFSPLFTRDVPSGYVTCLKFGRVSFFFRRRRRRRITELKQPRRPGGRRRQVNAEGLERERRFRREKET